MPVTFETRLENEEREHGQHNEDAAPVEEFRRKNRFKQVKFSIYLVAFQMSLLCLFVRFGSYSVRTDASLAENGISVAFGGGAGRTEAGQLLKNLTFQVILVVIFLGSSCSLTRYQTFTTGGQILNLVTISLGFQWSLLCRGLLHFLRENHNVNNPDPYSIRLDVHDMTEALLSTFSLLITSSFVLGRIAPVNVLSVILLQVPLYNVAKMLNEEVFLVSDPGSAMPIHLFGAVYGWMLHFAALRTRRPTIINHSDDDDEDEYVEEDNENDYGDIVGQNNNSNSDDLLSYLGSAILFISLPFLNGIISESDAEMTRSVINTVLSSTSALLSSFAVSVGIAHIQGNRQVSGHLLQGSLLSGGVAVGSVATLMLQPFGAMAVGSLTGLLTSASFVFLEPFIRGRFSLPCTCGLISFHGLPALIGALVSVIMALLSEDNSDQGSIVYHKSLYPIYPARMPLCTDNRTCTSAMGEIISNYPFLEDKGNERQKQQQRHSLEDNKQWS